MADSTMVTGLFRDRDSAEQAYRSVTDRGYSRDDVNVVMSDETRRRHFAGTERITKFAQQIILDLATAPERPDLARVAKSDSGGRVPGVARRGAPGGVLRWDSSCDSCRSSRARRLGTWLILRRTDRRQLQLLG